MSDEAKDYTTKHGNMKYAIGQKVIVVDDGESYSTYFECENDEYFEPIEE